MGKKGRKKKGKKKVKIDGNNKYEYILFTDGACVGNPGEMGIGGVVYYDGKIIESFSEFAGVGTNNEAEYMAIIKGLELLEKYKPSSICVYSDSLLVVNQLTEVYETRQFRLTQLRGAVNRNIKKLESSSIKNNKSEMDIYFVWVPREQNVEADALASKAVGHHQAVITDDFKIVKWEEDVNFVPDEDLLFEIPNCNPECEKRILEISQLQDLKFKDFISLKSGNDSYSRMKEERLFRCIEIRFGKSTVQWLKDALIDLDSPYSKKVLRWVARGLNPDLALKKVSVDEEMSSRFLKKKND